MFPRRRLLVALAAIWAAAAVGMLAGCGSGGGPAGPGALRRDRTTTWPSDVAGRPTAARQGCGQAIGATGSSGTFTVAVTDSVLPGHAPIPRNRGETLVFAQLYETLVRVDCQGDLQPGLASRWTCTQDSTVWVFSLRPDARFWDGTRVTAAEVRAAWCDAQDRLSRQDRTSPWTWLNAHAQTVTVLDAVRLSVRLPEPQADFPFLLAHPATAVAVRREGWTWPVGSGWARLRATTPAPLPELVCRPNPHHPDAPVWKELVFGCLPGRDPRDQADADLILVDALQDADFFSASGGFTVAPMPWTRQYLLLCPPAANPRGPALWWAGTSDTDVAASMTTVAWQRWPHAALQAGGDRACPQVSGPVSDRSSAPLGWDLAGLELDARTLVYPRGDVGARELAEHLAARTAFAARTVPLAEGPLSFVLQWQMAGAVILARDQEYPTGCLQLASLLGKASWMQEASRRRPPAVPDQSLVGARAALAPAAADPADKLLDSGWVRPLGVSRSWLVLREGLGGVHLAFDGTPLLDRLGRVAPPPQP